MFEQAALFQPLERLPYIDVGSLAEALVFYGNVALTGNAFSVGRVIRDVGIAELAELCALGNLKIRVLTGDGYYSGSSISKSRKRGKFSCIYTTPSRSTAGDVVLNDAVRWWGLDPAVDKKSWSGLQSMIEYLDNDRMQVNGVPLPVALNEKLASGDLCVTAAEAFIKSQYPEFIPAEGVHLKVTTPAAAFEDHPASVEMITNLDFESMFTKYSHSPGKPHPNARAHPHPGAILNLALYSMTQMQCALEGQGDIVLSPSALAVNKDVYDNIVARHSKMEQVNLFQEIVFEDSRAISWALTEGDRTFRDLIDLLKKRKPYSRWVGSLDNDKQLITSYLKEASSESWIEKLPAKVVRFGLFTGAGIGFDVALTGGLGTAAGLTIGAFDAFVLDKIVHGHPPNKFIEGPLKEFVARS